MFLLSLLMVSKALSHEAPPAYAVKAIPDSQLMCLTLNAFYEAMGEGRVGRQQVTQVVFNRTTNGDYCKTVYAPSQFSWTSTKKAGIPKDLNHKLRLEVLSLYYGLDEVPFKTATHFHTKRVKPAWRKSFTKLGAHGAHIFYVSPVSGSDDSRRG